MKQVILLEPHEVLRLQKGKQLEIATPGGTLVIGFDRNGLASAADTAGVQCNKCGKAFKNTHGLKVHAWQAHTDEGKKFLKERK